MRELSQRQTGTPSKSKGATSGPTRYAKGAQIPRATQPWNPTLTSKSATLGWGTRFYLFAHHYYYYLFTTSLRS